MKQLLYHTQGHAQCHRLMAKNLIPSTQLWLEAINTSFLFSCHLQWDLSLQRNDKDFFQKAVEPCARLRRKPVLKKGNWQNSTRILFLEHIAVSSGHSWVYNPQRTTFTRALHRGSGPAFLSSFISRNYFKLKLHPSQMELLAFFLKPYVLSPFVLQN